MTPAPNSIDITGCALAVGGSLVDISETSTSGPRSVASAAAYDVTGDVRALLHDHANQHARPNQVRGMVRGEWS